MTEFSTARRRITLRDVADRAGVHASTVSRALNPEKLAMVTPVVARRVADAAEQLGYRPNPIASSLRTNRTFTIGILIPDVTNPLFPPIIRGIENTLTSPNPTNFVSLETCSRHLSMSHLCILFAVRSGGALARAGQLV